MKKDNASWDKKEMYVMNKLDDIETHLDKIEEKLDREVKERNNIEKKITWLKAELTGIALITSTFITVLIRNLFK